MSCLHPRLGYQKYVNYSTYEKKMCFLPSLNSSLDSIDDIFDPVTGECLGPYLIPCGKCEGCRIDQSREWASRIVMEMLYYKDSSYFVTLTYDSDPSFWPENFRNHNGTLIYPDAEPLLNDAVPGSPMVLRKSHLQDFYKRFRKRFLGDELRYYSCGEYGSKNFRPHFHICMMGVPLLDLYAFGKSKTGAVLYRSPTLEKVWPFGYVALAPLNYSTAAYTARYCQKKAHGFDKDYFSSLGLTPEFTNMSTKPGLGTRYYEDHKEDIFSSDGQIVLPASSQKKSNVVGIPSFFKRKAKDDPALEPDLFRIKELSRRSSVDKIHDKIAMSDFDERSFFDVQEEIFSNRYSKLLRSLE